MIWSYMHGHSLLHVHKKNPFNSEAKSTYPNLLLFGDDTTIIGSNQELKMGK